MSERSSSISPPVLPDDESDRGSSVSSDMQNECDTMVNLALNSLLDNENKDSISPLTEMQPQVNNNSIPPNAQKEKKNDQNKKQESSTSKTSKSSSRATSSENLGRSADESVTSISPHLTMDVQIKHGRKNVTHLNDPLPCKEEKERLENVIDGWSFELKRNLLSEYDQAKFRLLNKCKGFAKSEEDRVKQSVSQLQDQIKVLQTLVSNYEETVKRKDSLIDSLSNELNKQKKQSSLVKNFANWRVAKESKKRDDLSTHVADHFHKVQLQKKAFDGLKDNLASTWRLRIGMQCETKAQKVCRELAQDYENQLQEMKKENEKLKLELQQEQSLRMAASESMKKALMRGVCALNMEAMTVFGSSGDDPDAIPRKPPTNTTAPVLRNNGFDSTSLLGDARSVTSSCAPPVAEGSRERWLNNDVIQTWENQQREAAQFVNENATPRHTDDPSCVACGNRSHDAFTTPDGYAGICLLTSPELRNKSNIGSSNRESNCRDVFDSASFTASTTRFLINPGVPDSLTDQQRRKMNQPSSRKVGNTSNIGAVHSHISEDSSTAVVRGDFLQNILNGGATVVSTTTDETPIDTNAGQMNNNYGNVSVLFQPPSISASDSARQKLRSSASANSAGRQTTNSIENVKSNGAVSSVTTAAASSRYTTLQVGAPTGSLSKSVASILVEKHQPVYKRTVAPPIFQQRELKQNSGMTMTAHDLRHQPSATRKVDNSGLLYSL